MGHSYFAVYLHMCWSTKHRRNWIAPEWEADAFGYLAAAVRNQGSTPIEVGGYRNHVHLLIGLNKTPPIPDLIKEIKRTSSGSFKQHANEFAWQAGYGVFSVSYSMVPELRRYIVDQARHHASMTWEQEFRALLTKHGIEFDERFFVD